MSVASESGVIEILPGQTTGARATGWWGMLLLIATEATFFASLVASYFYLASNAASWPPAGMHNPELTLTLPATFILLGSSLPMWWADRGIRQGRQGQLRLGLALAFVLGAVFLGIQVVEYSRKEFALDANTYSSLFYTITGLHGLHVLIGLLMNAYVQAQAWKGHFTQRRRLAVQNVAIYWHFVDAVWIVIFLSLYLSPRWF